MNNIVSVIVRQHNEVSHLKKLFQGIRSQKTDKKIEIVVVDSGSTDGSVEIAEQNADKLIRIKPESFTFGYSLNEGIKAASGEILIIVSAHTYPTSENWIASLIVPLSNEKICMSYGKQVGSVNSNPGEIFDFQRLFGDKPKIQKKPDYFTNNANSAIKKSLWSAHPFDESLSGLEDIEWSKHFLDQGYELAYVPGAEIVHIHNESPKQIRNRFFREALALRRMGLKRRFEIPSDAASEFISLLKDLAAGGMESKTKRKKILFHLNKIVGHGRGIFNGSKDESSFKKELQDTFNVSDNLSLVVRGPGDFGLENLPVPEIAPHEILLKPSYVGICGTDREIISGHLGYYASGFAKYPIVLGHEYSATVVKTGSKVSHLKIGDRVVGECILTCNHCGHCTHNHRLSCPERQEVGVLGVDGALAGLVKIPAHRAHLIPNNISMLTAALAEPTAVVIHSLKSAKLWSPSPSNQAANKKILITGLGSIGQIAARILKHQGYSNLSVFDISSDKLNMLPTNSCKIYTSAEEIPFEQFDCILEYSGNGKLLEAIFSKAASETTLLLVGFPYETALLNPESIVARQLNVVGSLGADSTDFADALQTLNHLDLTHHQKNIFKLAEFESALHTSTDPKILKCIIQVTEE